MILTALVLAAMPTSYQELPRVGQYIDVSQGYYVCREDNPRGVLARLLGEAYTTRRRDLADRLGCHFNVQDRAARFKVLAVKTSLCWDTSVARGGVVLDGGKIYQGPMRICGREGHDILISRGDGVTQRILWTSLDEEE